MGVSCVDRKRSAWGQSSISWNFAAVEEGRTWTKDKSSAPIRFFILFLVQKMFNRESHFLFSGNLNWRWVIQRKSYENLKLVPFQSDSDKRLGETVEIQQRNNGGGKFFEFGIYRIFFLGRFENQSSIIHPSFRSSTKLQLERYNFNSNDQKNL